MRNYALTLLLHGTLISVTFSMVFWTIKEWVLFAEAYERNSLEFKQSQINFTLPKNIYLGAPAMQQFKFTLR